MKKIGLVSIIVMLSLLLLPINARAADPEVFSPSSSPFGIKFREWSAQWWQFMLSIPASDNPLVDETGEKCPVGQRGPVWFLAGAFGGTFTRSCSLPEGKALLFPVMNLVDINVTNQTADELRAEIAPCISAATTLSVEVDGKPIKKIQDRFRVRSQVFEATFPVGGFLDPGTYSPVVDDGFYVMLRPLDRGTHTLRIRSAGPGCAVFPNAVSLDVTYTLTIVPVTLD